MGNMLGLNIFLQVFSTFFLIYGTLSFDKIRIRLFQEYPITISENNTRIIPKGRYKSKVELIIPSLIYWIGFVGYCIILSTIIVVLNAEAALDYNVDIDRDLFMIIWIIIFVIFNICIFKFHKHIYKNSKIKYNYQVKELREETMAEQRERYRRMGKGLGLWRGADGRFFLATTCLAVGVLIPYIITHQIVWIMNVIG